MHPTIEGFYHRLRSTPDQRQLTPADFGVDSWDFLKGSSLQIRIPEMKGLPEGVNFHGVDIRDAREMQRLPESIVGVAKLDLTGCSALQHLPAKIAPTWRRLRGCSSLHQLPEDFSPRFLDLVDCPAKPLPPMPGLEVLELRHGDYSRDISHLPIEEVVFVTSEVEERADTVSKADYMTFHRSLPKPTEPEVELPVGVSEVDLV